MTIIGIGTDIIEIERIRKASLRFKERFFQHLYTQKEREYCDHYRDPIPHFAGRFAAKEAVLKAIGTGLKKEIHWLDIEIINNPLGKPEVIFSSQLFDRLQSPTCLLSISHCKDYATAFVILSR